MSAQSERDGASSDAPGGERGGSSGTLSEPASVAAVILAAGLSLRFGDRAKQLAVVDGESLLRRTTKTVLASSCRPVVVVLPRCAELRGEIEDLDVEVAINAAPERGIASSLVCGLRQLGRAAGAEASAAIFVPIDQPDLRPEHLDRLAQRHRQHPGVIVQPRRDGTPTSPTLFPRRLFAQLAKLRGDEGGRQLIAAGETVEAVELGEDSLEDFDTAEALARYAARRAGGERRQ